MTDEEFDAMTAPTEYSELADPWIRGPFYLADAERVEPRSTCPNANNPFGHNRACACGWWQVAILDDGVDRDMEAYAVAEARRFDVEVDRQEGWF